MRAIRKTTSCVLVLAILVALMLPVVGTSAEAGAENNRSITGSITMSVLSASTVPEIKVFLDGRQLEFDVPPQIMNDRTMVPLRIIFEELGILVGWDDETRTITANKGDLVIILTIGSTSPTVNGEIVTIEQPAVITGDRTLVPLRFISESIGAEIDWDEESRSVYITSPPEPPMLKGKTADTPFSVLDDRFHIMMPEGSVDDAIYYGGIMGVQADSSGETRIRLTADRQIFLAYARELFRYSSGDITKDAKLFAEESFDSDQDYTMSEPVKTGNIEYVVLALTELHAQGSDLIKGALLKMSDKTLIFIGVYASEEALVYEEDCIALADSVIGSITEGKRVLETQPRLVTLYDYSLQLEKDYVFVVQMGIDFDVCYFYKIVPQGEDQPAFGIYSGWHPSLFGSRLPVHEEKAVTILGRDVVWDIYSSKEGLIDSETFIETLVQ